MDISRASRPTLREREVTRAGAGSRDLLIYAQMLAPNAAAKQIRSCSLKPSRPSITFSSSLVPRPFPPPGLACKTIPASEKKLGQLGTRLGEGLFCMSYRLQTTLIKYYTRTSMVHTTNIHVLVLSYGSINRLPAPWEGCPSQGCCHEEPSPACKESDMKILITSFPVSNFFYLFFFAVHVQRLKVGVICEWSTKSWEGATSVRQPAIGFNNSVLQNSAIYD